MSVELAKRLAAVTQLSTKAESSMSVTPTAPMSVAPTDALQLPPELAASIPDHIKAVVPVKKLLEQSRHFKMPPWVAIPVVALHMECVRDNVRMAPLALDRYPTYLLGQSSVCDFRLEHTSISRVHAALAYHGEQQCFVVVDLKSTNGIRVNGKRVEPGRPIPLPVGSVLEVGLSARKYIMCKGVASKEAKRPREDDNVCASSSTGKGDVAEPLAHSSNHSGGSDSASPRKIAAEVASLPPETQEEVIADVPAKQPAARELRHILLKHRECKNPKSLNAANKGEIISRTLAEALALAANIKALHSSWTEDAFVAASTQFSECSTSKKGGALGVVNPGDFAEEFEANAFGIEAGCVGEPFVTPLGVHLVFCVKQVEKDAHVG